MTTDQQILLALYRKMQASDPTQPFISVPIAEANLLQRINGEGPFLHGQSTHGYTRDQLNNLIDAGLAKLTNHVYRTLSN